MIIIMIHMEYSLPTLAPSLVSVLRDVSFVMAFHENNFNMLLTKSI